jgi:hypothetical protein
MYVCPYGVFIIAEAAGDITVTKQDGDEHNSRKMSIILVEGVS